MESMEEGLMQEANIIENEIIENRLANIGCCVIITVFVGIAGGLLYISQQFSEKIWL
jgi:hypothetical protein